MLRTEHWLRETRWGVKVKTQDSGRMNVHWCVMICVLYLVNQFIYFLTVKIYMNLCTYRVFITKAFYSRLKVRIISLSLMFYRIKHQKQNKRDQTQTLENNPEQRGGLNTEYMCVHHGNRKIHIIRCVCERERELLKISTSPDLTVSTPVRVSIKHLMVIWWSNRLEFAQSVKIFRADDSC